MAVPEMGTADKTLRKEEMNMDMPKISKKQIIIIICAVIAICATVGGTIAYLFAKTNEITNSFTPVFVSCEVQERFDGVTKTDVRIKNTGDIKAYIRATFVAMWVSEEGHVYSSAPVEGQDYSLTLGSAKWSKGSDGFYYYASAVHAGESTDILVASISQMVEGPEGYSLMVHVAATAIQSEPAAAVEQAWGASVQSDGKLAAPK